ncbi:MAG: hypothetical protein HOV71_05500 [Hamadaea sp.]|nr:hypothetical protein [Hamadaea sp.]NUR47573.1 hypothetical protein [Hamadaea sp.]NUT05824.1 hypothetical protein [Hamadaea sp.]
MEEIARMPALTRAEADVVDSYTAILEYLARVNPARQDETYGALRAAQALVTQATALRDALALMFQRGETTIHSSTLVRALLILDADKSVDRLTLAGR